MIKLTPFLARVIVCLIVLLAVGIWYAKQTIFSSEFSVIRACGVMKTSDPEQRACYAAKFREITRENGAAQTLAILGTMFDRFGLEYGECHVTAHAIGWEAFYKYATRTEAFSQLKNESACSSGYYHGIIEEFMKTDPLLEHAAQVICSDAMSVDVSERGRYQCYHGLGHTLMALTDYELPRALAICDLLGERRNNESCYHGVFMENILAGHFRKEATTDWVRPQDVFYPCNSIGDRYSSACYNWSATLIFRYETKDPRQAVRSCERLPSDRLKQSCYSGMGRHFVSALNFDLEEIASACVAGDRRFASACLTTAAHNIINADGGFRRAGAFCKVVPKEYQTFCAAQAGSMSNTMRLAQGEKEAMCRRYFSEWLTACLGSRPT